MARINARSIAAVAAAQTSLKRDDYNAIAISEATDAFVACKCHVCTDKAIPPTSEQCPAERKLWAEIERGEDMQIARASEALKARRAARTR